VTIGGDSLEAGAMDYQDGVLRLRFANRAETVPISVSR
jgi:hypothetical protein